MANNLFNNYIVSPKNLTQYTAYRGVTDFSNVGQFNQYETGYQFLSVIQLPKFMTALEQMDPDMVNINASFKHMLEYEFRGLDGLPDITADTFTITDGINELNMINRVTMDTSITVSSSFFEKSGQLITKYSEYYLTGIKDPKTQAKTYHGAIRNNLIAPGLENEVFTLLYYVTDNTMLRLERAVLLANAQLTKAETSMYNGSRDNISNHETSIEFNCFPIMGTMVDKAANALLADITGYMYNKKNAAFNGSEKTKLDSMNYKYGIMGGEGSTDSPETIAALKNAINSYTL